MERLISANKLIKWIEKMKNEPVPDDSNYIYGRMIALDLLKRCIEDGFFDPDKD